MLRLFVFLLSLTMCCSCSFEKMFYYPDRVLSNKEEADSLGFKQVDFLSKNGKNLNGYLVTPRDTVYGMMLFLHGNAGDIDDRITSLKILQDGGFEVLIFDYQGFGKSQGVVSHQNLADDAESAFKYLQNLNKDKKLPVIVFGRSIGGHLAVKIAHDHQNEIKALVIEGAFTCHHDIAVAVTPFWLSPFASLLVKSQYNAKKLIKDLTLPKLIIHSTEDEVVPYWMGVELYKKATEPKEFWKIKGCHICGLELYQKEYLEKLRKICLDK